MLQQLGLVLSYKVSHQLRHFSRWSELSTQSQKASSTSIWHMPSSMLFHGEEEHFSVRDDTFWNTSCWHGMKNFAVSSTFKRATPSGLVTLFC